MNHSFRVRHRRTVGQCREPRIANNLVNLGMKFLLDVAIPSHKKKNPSQGRASRFATSSEQVKDGVDERFWFAAVKTGLGVRGTLHFVNVRVDKVTRLILHMGGQMR